MELLLIILSICVFLYFNHQSPVCTNSKCDPDYNYKKTAQFTNIKETAPTDYNTLKYNDYDHYTDLIFGKLNYNKNGYKNQDKKF